MLVEKLYELQTSDFLYISDFHTNIEHNKTHMPYGSPELLLKAFSLRLISRNTKISNSGPEVTRALRVLIL
jgi:hypothetical protein